MPYDLNQLLLAVRDRGGSDLHLTVGIAPVIRLNGALRAIGDSVLTCSSIQQLLFEIMSEAQRSKLERELECDFAHSIPGEARFRVNAYFQRNSMGAAFRLIPKDIRSIEELVEDPIEYLHSHNLSVINQREVGSDTHSFAQALRSVLRQDPDVILIGEMRDLETISAALTAAETGHLVFATLHTVDATQTIDRIVDVFSPHQQNQLRVQTGLSQGMLTMDSALADMYLQGKIAYDIAMQRAVDTGTLESLIRDR